MNIWDCVEKGPQPFDTISAFAIVSSHDPIVCTVSTKGLSDDSVKRKAVLAARLAMTALALAWEKPSIALEWMYLSYDDRSGQRTQVMLRKNHEWNNVALTNLKNQGGGHIDSEWENNDSHSSEMLDQIGDALSKFTNSDFRTIRPRTLDALFLSLWWFHQACREEWDQIAIAKFAFSMEALTRGGSKKGVTNFIEKRLGYQENDIIPGDDRSRKIVIDEIFQAGRNGLTHGFSDVYAHDWTKTRATAEFLGKQCIISACEWMHQNQISNDVKCMSLEDKKATKIIN
jgi:hypothetical protein